jgi:hypothetical protein
MVSDSTSSDRWNRWTSSRQESVLMLKTTMLTQLHRQKNRSGSWAVGTETKARFIQMSGLALPHNWQAPAYWLCIQFPASGKNASIWADGRKMPGILSSSHWKQLAKTQTSTWRLNRKSNPPSKQRSKLENRLYESNSNRWRANESTFAVCLIDCGAIFFGHGNAFPDPRLRSCQRLNNQCDFVRRRMLHAG